MLGRACRDAGVRFEGYAASVIYEDHFNHRVSLTHSKASVSFTAVHDAAANPHRAIVSLETSQHVVIVCPTAS